MLIDFSVSNYRSFSEKQTLTLEASKPKKSSETTFHTLETYSKQAPYLYATTAIFGANASGKSNLITALKFFVNIITNSIDNKVSSTFDRDYFRLDPKYKDLDTTFTISLITNFEDQQGLYTYEVSLNNNVITKEFLSVKPLQKGNIRVLLDRTNNDWILHNSLDHKLSGIEDNVLKNHLLLTYIADKSHNTYLDELFNFFTNNLHAIPSNKLYNGYTHEMILSKEYDYITEITVLKFLQSADFNINHIEVEKQEINQDELERLEKLFNILGKDINQQDIQEENKAITINLKSYKKDMNGTMQEFDFDQAESTGTKILYSLAGPILRALHEGEVLVIDELDSNVHSKLIQFIFNIFEDKIINKNNAQLIITSHSEALMDLGLNPEQLFLTELNENKATELFSIADFKSTSAKSDRNNNLSKKYLDGKFGGVSHFNITNLDKING